MEYTDNFSLKKAFLKILVIFLIWRGALFVFDFIGMSFTSERTNNPNKDYQAYPQKERYFLDGWFRWDSGWYKRIAERGYYIEGHQSDVAFFPLFPYLSRYLGYITGSHFLAGFLISNFSTLFAIFFMYLIALSMTDEERAKRSIILLLLFPASFFLSAYYTEGLFLLTITGSTYFFLRKNYFLAGLFGMAAMLTRSTGIILFITFSIYILYEILGKREKFSFKMLFLLLIPSGLLLFMIMLKVQVGDPLAFSKFQAGWGRHFVFPLFTPFIELYRVNWSFPRDDVNMQKFIEAVTSLLFLLIAVVMIVKKYHPVLWMIVLFGILMPLSTGKVMSMIRFSAVLFPAFYYISDICEDRNTERFIIFLFVFFLALFNLRFLNWYWAG
ncbi:MAG: glycosyltransferase family 39 protein [Deltaproteobacteria bacterium]|nr:glycosyltransferase family 39 protein [Deltaproteobacteria bacterium]